MNPLTRPWAPRKIEPTSRGASMFLVAPVTAVLRRGRRSTLIALLALTVSASHAHADGTLIGVATAMAAFASTSW